SVRQLRPPLRVRTGIASGAVVASPTGSQAHTEYTVTGSAVNLAARLHDLATADEILVSGAVRRALAALVDAVAVERASLKGITGQVPVWRLDGLREATPIASGPPVVGRTAELATMERLLERCRTRGAGQVLHLRGEPGIG